MTELEEKKKLIKEIKRLKHIAFPSVSPYIITIENTRTIDGNYVFNADSALRKIQELPEKDRQKCLKIIEDNENTIFDCRFCILRKKHKQNRWVLEFDATDDSEISEESMEMIVGTDWY